MKLARFLKQVQLMGGTAISPEHDPLLLILRRVGMNRYTLESQALLRVCLAVVATAGKMVESDLWALGSDARGLLNAFAVRRSYGEYEQTALEMLAKRLNGYQESISAMAANQAPQ